MTQVATEPRPSTDAQKYFLSGVANGLREQLGYSSSTMPSVTEWISANMLKTEKGIPFEFKNHAFLLKPLNDWNPFQVMIKASQVGFTMSMILKSIYACKYKNFNILYSLPTLEMIQKQLVPVKVNPLIEANQELKKLSDPKTQTMLRKQFGMGWIMFRGCEATSGMLMDSCDLIVNDEVDESDRDVVEGFKSRLKASEYRGEWFFSNPKVAGSVSDLLFNDFSNGQYWHHTCSRCNYTFFMDWPDCIDIDKQIYICPSCHGELREEDRAKGEWVRRWRDRSEGGTKDRPYSGYWINHLMCPWMPATEIVKAYRETTADHFNRFIIAKPDTNEENRITRDLIIKNLSDLAPKKKPCVAGIDQGSKYHMVIGNPEGIFKLLVFDTWEQVEGAMEDYGVAYAICDGLPDRDGAGDLQKHFPGKVLLNMEARERKMKGSYKFDFASGYAWTFRHLIISNLLKEFMNGTIKIFVDRDEPALVGSGSKDTKAYLGQAESLRRKKEIGNDGNERYVWKSTGGHDHFIMASCYWAIARDRLNQAKQILEPQILEDAPTDYSEYGDDAWMFQ